MATGAFLCLSAASGFSQSLPQQPAAVDFSSYYRFPFSLGVEYQSLTPFGAFGKTFNTYGLAMSARMPVPSIPSIQPSLDLGLLQFEDRSPGSDGRWSHQYWYGALGATYAARFAKSFELAVELSAGFAEAVFPRLDPTGVPVGSPTLLFKAGGRIALDPSYGLSIDIHPTFTYLLSLSPLSDFNGLLFGLGFSAHYRFGEDPDAPQAQLRYIRFDGIAVEPLFAGMQSYYVKNRIGTATITNTASVPLTDVAVSFFQKGYMDSPTPVAAIARIAPGETRTIDLLASFNSEVFATQGITPLVGEIAVDYTARGRPVGQRQSVSYDLYDRSAIVWDDDRKVAAFITPADTAMRNYASFVRKAVADSSVLSYPDAVQFAAAVFNALAELGITYTPDPSTPFTSVQGKQRAVDSVNLPRITLTRASGDCDDLTVLYATLLESVGIESGFITTPGHIYAALNTKLPSASWAQVHPERAMTIAFEGEVWVPVEITLIGRGTFLEAWRRGADEFATWEKDPAKRTFATTASAQAVFRPVGLKEADLGLQYGRSEKTREGFRADMGSLVDALVRTDREAAEKTKGKKEYNRLATRYARYGRFVEAEQALRRSLAIDAGYVPARVNLATVQMSNQQYSQAVNGYQAVLDTLRKTGKAGSPIAVSVLLNLSRAYYEAANFEEAKKSLASATAIDKASAERFTLVIPEGSGEARAARASVSPDAILIEEE
jgi:transglutaminase-like putative cysteine protease